MTVTATRQTDGASPHQIRFSLPIESQSGVYLLSSNTSDSKTFSHAKTISVPNDPGSLRSLGGPLLLAVGLLGLVGLAFARSRGAITLSQAEREWLAYLDDRTDFDEWIATIRLPDDAEELPRAEAETLADLVDFAIDTDNAVLEQPDGSTYFVVHDGYRYRFEAPTNPSSEPGRPLGSNDRPDARDDRRTDPSAETDSGGETLD